MKAGSIHTAAIDGSTADITAAIDGSTADITAAIKPHSETADKVYQR